MSDTRQIIITGISSALGNILAEEFAKEDGVKIIATMRRKRKHADKFPENVHVIDDCDLLVPAKCRALANTVKRRFEGEFGFIHSVGEFWDHVPFLEFGPGKAARMFASHVTTFYNVLQSLIPLMKSRGGGSCIAFSCNSTIYNYPWMAAFSASKNAVDSLVVSLANEYSGENLRFNSIRLSSLKTKSVKASKPHGDFDHYTPPGDIVPIIRFLLARDSYLVNGNTITVFKHSDRFFNEGYFERIAK